MSPETIDAMLGAGATAEVIAAAWKAEIVSQEARQARQIPWQQLRQMALARDGESCGWCGCAEGPFEVDHVVPLAKGGENILTNVIVACRSCNRAKKDRDESEWSELHARRVKDRERKRRQRRRDNNVTTRDMSRGQADVSQDPPKSISTPFNPVSPDGETPLLSQSDDVSEAVGVWNETAERCGLPKVRTLAGSRLQRLRRRIAENGIDGMREAVAAVERSAFCRGEVNGFRADIGFLTRPENFAKLIEGGFDQAEVKPKSAEPVDFVAHYAAEKKRMAAGASR